MALLAIDTCWGACSVAIAATGPSGPRIIADAHRAMSVGHAEALLPMIESVFGTAGLNVRDIDRIVVTRGPGTFTGLRTGLAAARGLALATGCPLIGISSLWAMACSARLKLGAEMQSADALVATVAGRHGEVFLEILDNEGQTLDGPLHLASSSAAARLPAGRVVAVGPGAMDLKAAATTVGKAIDAALHDLTPRASAFAIPAADRTPQESDASPLYLRAPDATPAPRAPDREPVA